MPILRNIAFGLIAAFSIAGIAQAQIVPAQNQQIVAPYGGFVVATSTSPTSKLSATSTPYFANFFATNGNITNLTVGSCTGCTSGSVFSTTSADYWKTQRNFFSTTSADYWITSTTTLPSITALPNLTTVKTTLTGILKAVAGVLSIAVANTDYQVPITLTTTGSSGVATFNGTILNIPNYTFTDTVGNWFIPSTFGGTTVSATGTPIQVTSSSLGFLASSTSYLYNLISFNSTSTNATTTNFAITGIASSLLKTTAAGTVVPAIAGTDYQTFGYPFPNNATTTTLTFSQGLVSVGSTTVNGPLTLSTTTSGCLNISTGGIVYAASCAAAGTGYPFTPTTNYGVLTSATSSPIWARAGLFASSTSNFDQINVGSSTVSTMATSTFSGHVNVVGNASSSALVVSGTPNCSGTTALNTNAAGRVVCGTVTGDGVGTWFTPTNNYAVNTSATSTPLWARAAIFASSTSHFDQIDVGSSTAGTMATSSIFGHFSVLGNASSTALIVSGTPNCSGTSALNTNAAGRVVCGTVTTNASFSTTSADYWITATTTLPSITTLANLGTVKTTLTGNLQSNSGVLYTVSTSSITAGAGISFTGTPGALLGGTNLTIIDSNGYPFTSLTNYGILNSATSSDIWAQTGINASSTSNFDQIIVGSSTVSTMATSSIFGHLTIAGNASSTALVISGTPGCSGTNALNTDAAGRIVCGATSGGGSAFPFTPTNNYAVNTSATSTPIWARLGLFASSTSNFDQVVIGSSTISTMATSSVFGHFTVSGNASSTALTISGVPGCSGTNALNTNAAGRVVCGAASGSFSFTPTNNYGVNTSATSTPIWAQLGLFASSTSNFDQINVGSSTVSTMATSTIFGHLAVRGNASSTSLVISELGASAGSCLTINAAGRVITTSCGGGSSDEKWATSTNPTSGIYPNSATYVGFGTTTPRFLAQFSSSTAIQIMLSNATNGGNGYGWRAQNGVLTLATTSLNTFATTSMSSIFNITQAGRVSIGLNAPTVPGATLQLYEQEGTGASPSILLGGNTGGDTDFWLARISDNDGLDDDSFQIGTSTTPNTNPVFTIRPFGYVGIGTTTPYGLLSVNAPATTTPWFVIGSSTAEILKVRASTNNYPTVGIGTTTPWGILSIAAAAYDYLEPLFTVSTSTGRFGGLLSIFGTSTTLQGDNPNQKQDSGARVSIGDTGYFANTGIIDQLNIAGRINTNDWAVYNCPGYTYSTGASLSVRTSSVCGDWGVGFDQSGSLSGEGITQAAVLNINTGTTNGGVGLWTNQGAANTNGLFVGSTTPVLEASIHLKSGVANFAIGSSTAIVGFTNINNTGSSYEVAPTNGCYFIASSTEANWKAICGAATTGTYVDTGIASTSAGYTYLRVQVDTGKAEFYMRTSTSTMRKVASITTNLPTSAAAVMPGIYVSRVSAAGNTGMYVNYAHLWVYKDPTNNP